MYDKFKCHIKHVYTLIKYYYDNLMTVYYYIIIIEYPRMLVSPGSLPYRSLTLTSGTCPVPEI